MAADLIELPRRHVDKPRAELKAALLRMEGSRMGYKIFRGLSSILLDCVNFQPEQALDFPALRLQLFEFAESFRPIFQTHDLLHQTSRDAVLQAFEKQHGALPKNLYGDLPDAHLLRIQKPLPDPKTLLRRYNLALAQGLLYRCLRMHIRIRDSFKTVFHYLKLAGLMLAQKWQMQAEMITRQGIKWFYLD